MAPPSGRDDVEGGDNGWTTEVETFAASTGPGWRIDTGTSTNAQYYLVEWRNFDGFDEGLKYGYDTVYSDGAWKVEKITYNAPVRSSGTATRATAARTTSSPTRRRCRAPARRAAC